jgi:hypothetical protein
MAQIPFQETERRYRSGVSAASACSVSDIACQAWFGSRSGAMTPSTDPRSTPRLRQLPEQALPGFCMIRHNLTPHLTVSATPVHGKGQQSLAFPRKTGTIGEACERYQIERKIPGLQGMCSRRGACVLMTWPSVGNIASFVASRCSATAYLAIALSQSFGSRTDLLADRGARGRNFDGHARLLLAGMCTPRPPRETQVRPQGSRAVDPQLSRGSPDWLISGLAAGDLEILRKGRFLLPGVYSQKTR